MAERTIKKIDWLLFLFIVPITLAGLITMKAFSPLEGVGDFFSKQIIWVAISFAVFFLSDTKKKDISDYRVGNACTGSL